MNDKKLDHVGLSDTGIHWKYIPYDKITPRNISQILYESTAILRLFLKSPQNPLSRLPTWKYYQPHKKQTRREKNRVRQRKILPRKVMMATNQRERVGFSMYSQIIQTVPPDFSRRPRVGILLILNMITQYKKSRLPNNVLLFIPGGGYNLLEK